MSENIPGLDGITESTIRAERAPLVPVWAGSGEWRSGALCESRLAQP